MPITYKAPFVPDYPTEEDRVTEVGPMFEAATSTNLPTDGVPLGATQPSVAPGPSAPPAGGPGTITYGSTVVTPKHYAGDANQPLPWWYNEMLAKEEARKEQAKAAQREMDARYWAEQEFKRRTGNLVPKTMEEATKASMEMRRIESQLGLQYDINAGVPIEKALAKWGGGLGTGAGGYGNFGRTGLLGGIGVEPKIYTKDGVNFVVNQRTGAISVLPTKPDFGNVMTVTTEGGKNATIIGNRIIQEATPKAPPRIVTAELPSGEKLQMTAEAAIPHFEGKIAEAEENVRTSKGPRLKTAQRELEGYKRALESVKRQIESKSTANVPLQPSGPVVREYRIENGRLVPKK